MITKHWQSLMPAHILPQNLPDYAYYKVVVARILSTSNSAM
jgi:hypothetical protein